MRHLEEPFGGARIERARGRAAVRRPLDREAVAPEQEQVEVELAGPPAPAPATPGLPFEGLQRDEEVGGAGGGMGAGRDVERDHRVEEVRLVRHADRGRAVQARHPAEASAGKRAEVGDRPGQRRARVADVRSQPDVRPNPSQVVLPAVCESGRVPHVAVRILHPEPAADAGELTRLLARARALVAEDLAPRFEAAGAHDVRIVRGRPDGVPFGPRLRALVEELPAGAGLVVLGSGSIPLAHDGELRTLVSTAASGEARAATNSFFSADVVALGDASVLAAVPDLATDNALPRWLEAAGVAIEVVRDGRRLDLDLDSPLDLELLRRSQGCPAPLAELAGSSGDLLAGAAEAFDRLAALARDPRGELLVAGRVSGRALVELEERTQCRIRALVEERGLRTAVPGQRPPASALGLLLDHEGPGAVGSIVEHLADGALVDTRVLLAHRGGADEAGWPAPEDRYASDLLLPDRIGDAWLRELTEAAWSHPAPIALGGHSLVGPGLAPALGL